MILSGDRNLGTMTVLGAPSGGSVSVSPGGTTSGGAIPGGLAWTSASIWAWTANDMHLKTGNLGLTDGSVQTTTVSAAQTAFINATNGYASTIYYNFPNQ